MGLEASEVAVRVRLLGGSAFEKEAKGVAGSTEAIGTAGKRANETIASSGNKAHNVLSKTGSKMQKLGNTVTGLGRSLTTMGVPLAALGYYSVKSSAQFTQAMTLLVTQANLPQKALAGLTQSVQQLAPTFGKSPLALAQALYPITSIGLRGKQALDALKASAIGSAVGLDSLENTADAVTTIMASHIKGSGGPVEAMSIMDRAIGLGKMHLEDLTQSFKSQIVPMSAAFGLNFKQIVASAAALTRVGTPASSAMARMRLALTSMVSPTASGSKALAAMGIHHSQLASDLRSPGGLLTALEDLKMHTAGMSKNTANDLIAQIFGKSRGMGQISTLLNVLPQMEKIYGTVMGTTPATLMQHFGQTKQTSAFKFQQMKAAFDTAMITLGNTITKYLLPVLPQLVKDVSSVVKWFGQLSPSLKKFFLILMGLTIVGGPILLFAGALIKVGGALFTFAGWLTTAGAGAEAAVGVEGGAGLLGAIGAAGTAFLGLLGPLALLLGVVDLVTRGKNSVPYKAGNAIYHAGKSVGSDVARFLVGNPSNPADYYLKSWEFRHLNKIQQADVLWRLSHPNADLSKGHNAAMAGFHSFGQSDLAGVNMPNLPGLHPSAPAGFSSNVASSSAGFSVTIHSPFYLDGKVIANVVNTVNRKAMNRR